MGSVQAHEERSLRPAIELPGGEGELQNVKHPGTASPCCTAEVRGTAASTPAQIQFPASSLYGAPSLWKPVNVSHNKLLHFMYSINEFIISYCTGTFRQVTSHSTN